MFPISFSLCHHLNLEKAILPQVLLPDAVVADPDLVLLVDQQKANVVLPPKAENLEMRKRKPFGKLT